MFLFNVFIHFFMFFIVFFVALSQWKLITSLITLYALSNLITEYLFHFFITPCWKGYKMELSMWSKEFAEIIREKVIKQLNKCNQPGSNSTQYNLSKFPPIFCAVTPQYRWKFYWILEQVVTIINCQRNTWQPSNQASQITIIFL